jgi:hypothetical protein
VGDDFISTADWHASQERVEELERTLRTLIELHTNRYACADHWNQCFKDARKVLDNRK